MGRGVRTRRTRLAQEGPAAVIVFDNSGSMWGKIDGDKGTSWAPRAMRSRHRWKSSGRTSRPASSRSAAAAATVPTSRSWPARGAAMPTASTSRWTSSIPRAEGRSCWQRAKRPRRSGLRGPASVILIHDDPDNCQQDACAAADDIKREHRAQGARRLDRPEERGHGPHELPAGDDRRAPCSMPRTATQLAAFIDEASDAVARGPVTSPKPPPAPVPATRPVAATRRAPSAVAAAATPPPARGSVRALARCRADRRWSISSRRRSAGAC